jgi:DNA-binding NarL/FixJ family response regulator
LTGTRTTMEAFRILIADDHEVVRGGIRTMLEAHPGWEVCAEAADGREAVERSREFKPDVAILDLGMPNLNGLEATRQILAASPQTKILILTMHDSNQVVRESVAAGARGFLLKTEASRELVTAVEALQDQRTYFAPGIAEMIMEEYLHPTKPPSLPASNHLTPREREVIQLLAEGKRTREVANVLHLSVKTAETHRTNIMHKLNIHSIAELTLYAVRNGIVRIF